MTDFNRHLRSRSSVWLWLWLTTCLILPQLWLPSAQAESAAPTRNDVLARMYKASRFELADPESQEPIVAVESVYVLYRRGGGDGTLEYSRQGRDSRLLRDGEMVFQSDGLRTEQPGRATRYANADWLFPVLLGLEPLPELFGNIQLFPVAEGGHPVLLCRRDRYRTQVVIRIDATGGLPNRLEIREDSHRAQITIEEYEWKEIRRIPTRLRIDGAAYRLETLRWNFSPDE